MQIIYGCVSFNHFLLCKTSRSVYQEKNYTHLNLFWAAMSHFKVQAVCDHFVALKAMLLDDHMSIDSLGFRQKTMTRWLQQVKRADW